MSFKTVPIAKPFIGKEEKKAVIRVLDSGLLAQGRITGKFEKRFSGFCNVKHAIMTSSGTTALQTCVHVAGIEENDKVITTPFSFIASANCILTKKARPVFVDISEDTYNIDPEKVEEAIDDKTKAIIPVDLFGHPYDYGKIKKIANKNNFLVIEDAYQAVGAEYKGRKTGSLGDIAAFSLYATKNIIGGEGGVITTDNDEFAEKAGIFINQGQQGRYDYVDIGFNYRISDIHAAIALEQLKKIDLIAKKRSRNAELLIKGLKGITGITVPVLRNGIKHGFHQFSIKVDGYKSSRDALLEKLRKNGVGATVYYPQPLHLTALYAGFGYKKGDFPVAEETAEKILSLPVHPNVSKKDIQKIIDVIRH
uniref:Perosamine synthetase n=1 Tax=Candidatus Kentrum sp. FW TaxID=2126338 RepID=A0A450T5W3_9GAMM|nr:MAG: perosamine synthetase [Candidatus Kentron sp. FW]